MRAIPDKMGKLKMNTVGLLAELAPYLGYPLTLIPATLETVLLCSNYTLP